jgi:hypothetical protein
MTKKDLASEAKLPELGLFSLRSYNLNSIVKKSLPTNTRVYFFHIWSGSPHGVISTKANTM